MVRLTLQTFLLSPKGLTVQRFIGLWCSMESLQKITKEAMSFHFTSIALECDLVFSIALNSTYVLTEQISRDIYITFSFSQLWRPNSCRYPWRTNWFRNVWWQWWCLSTCVSSEWRTNPFRRRREMVFFWKHGWMVVVDSHWFPINGPGWYSWDRARVGPGTLWCRGCDHVALCQPWESWITQWWQEWDKCPVFV